MNDKRTEQLALITKDLMLKEPFYGLFLVSLNKVWTDVVPTAGVRFSGINQELALNPQFWDQLSPAHRLGLTKHELLHIAFMHTTDFDILADKSIANVAMDLEVNQYINDENLPAGACTLDTFAHLPLKKKAGTFYYYDTLKNAKDKKTQQMLQDIKDAMGQGQIKVVFSDGTEMNLTDHSMWEDFKGLDEATKKLVQKQLAYTLNEVKDQVVKSRGTIPSEIEVLLNSLLKEEPPKFDWRSYLRRFAGGSMLVYTKKLRRKFNKRFEDNPGLKIKKKKHILVAVDTSGSVSDSELQEFFSEIDHIHRTGAEVTVIQCDSAISNISPYKRNQEIKVYGRGGTSFHPVVDYYNENTRKYTCLIYLTDGEAPAPDKAKGRMLWVMSSKSKINPELHGPQIKLN